MSDEDKKDREKIQSAVNRFKSNLNVIKHFHEKRKQGKVIIGKLGSCEYILDDGQAVTPAYHKISGEDYNFTVKIGAREGMFSKKRCSLEWHKASQIVSELNSMIFFLDDNLEGQMLLKHPVVKKSLKYLWNVNFLTQKEKTIWRKQIKQVKKDLKLYGNENEMPVFFFDSSLRTLEEMVDFPNKINSIKKYHKNKCRGGIKNVRR